MTLYHDMKSRIEELAAAYGRLAVAGQTRRRIVRRCHNQTTASRFNDDQTLLVSSDFLAILPSPFPTLRITCISLTCSKITLNDTFLSEQSEITRQTLLRHRRESIVLAKRNQLKRKLHQTSPPLVVPPPATIVAPLVTRSSSQHSTATQTLSPSLLDMATQTEKQACECCAACDNASTSTTVDLLECRMAYTYHLWDIDYKHYVDVFDSPLFSMFGSMWRLSLFRTSHYYSISLYHFQAVARRSEAITLHCMIQLYLMLLPPYTIHTRDPLFFSRSDAQVNIIDDVISVAELQHFVSSSGCLALRIGLRELEESTVTTHDSDEMEVRSVAYEEE